MTPSPMIRFIVSRPSCDATCSARSSDCAFRVAWAINPHMRVGAAHPSIAVRQHRAYVRALQAAGAQVISVPFVHGAFDSVFAKDNAVVVERANGAIEALLAQPRYAERRAEQRARAHAFEAAGIRAHATCDAPLEGGDVVPIPSRAGAFLGHGFRSSARARDELERFLERPVTCLSLRDPNLYHLDMALSVLDDGTALVCEEALTADGLDAIARHPGVRSVVRVAYGEALRFGTNLVQIRQTILSGGDAPEMARALRSRGYVVERVALDQFHLAGGSAACLVSRVHRQIEETPARRFDAASAAA